MSTPSAFSPRFIAPPVKKRDQEYGAMDDDSVELFHSSTWSRDQVL